MSICTWIFEVMMFCATVRVNIQESKLINLEFCYELRRIQLFPLYTARVLNKCFHVPNRLFLRFVWSVFVVNLKFSTSPTQNTSFEYVVDQMQPVHAENCKFLLLQITAYYLRVSVVVLPDIHFEVERDIYKCDSVTRWFSGAAYALLHSLLCDRCKIVTTVNFKTVFLIYVTPYSLICYYHCTEEICCFHLQCRIQHFCPSDSTTFHLTAHLWIHIKFYLWGLS
jgi:hypothetical protein